MQVDLATGGLSAGVTLVMAWYAEPLIRLTVGEQFAAAGGLLVLQTLGVTLFLFGVALRPALFSMGLQMRFLQIVTLSMVCFLRHPAARRAVVRRVRRAARAHRLQRGLAGRDAGRPAAGRQGRWPVRPGRSRSGHLLRLTAAGQANPDLRRARPGRARGPRCAKRKFSPSPGPTARARPGRQPRRRGPGGTPQGVGSIRSLAGDRRRSSRPYGPPWSTAVTRSAARRRVRLRGVDEGTGCPTPHVAGGYHRALQGRPARSGRSRSRCRELARSAPLPERGRSAPARGGPAHGQPEPHAPADNAERCPPGPTTASVIRSAEHAGHDADIGPGRRRSTFRSTGARAGLSLRRLRQPRADRDPQGRTPRHAAPSRVDRPAPRSPVPACGRRPGAAPRCSAPAPGNCGSGSCC